MLTTLLFSLLVRRAGPFPVVELLKQVWWSLRIPAMATMLRPRQETQSHPRRSMGRGSGSKSQLLHPQEIEVLIVLSNMCISSNMLLLVGRMRYCLAQPGCEHSCSVCTISS